MERPEPIREEYGAQYATGLASIFASKSDNYGISNTVSDMKKAGLKTKIFLRQDERILRFVTIETDPPSLQNKEKLTSAPRRFALKYFLSDGTMEARLIKSTRKNLDDANVLLKRCQLPKNWREVQNTFAAPIYYTEQDMVCGNVIDCYGRFILIVDCDPETKAISEELGIEQHELPIPQPESPKVAQIIPKLGEDFLPIGSEEDTLRNVYGTKPQPVDYKKIEENHHLALRARVRMVSPNHVDASRTFLLTYYLDTDYLQLFEEQRYNSGVIGGNFLKRGRYVNTLPPDSEMPRYFKPQDIFLGNVIGTGGAKFQIIEMDVASMKLCESKPQEFPLFDAFRIATSVLPRVIRLGQDLRSTLSGPRIDRQNAKWLSKDVLLSVLESLQITKGLNDQELLTLIRRVKDTDEEKYYYHELCDLFSHLGYVSTTGGRSSSVGRTVSRNGDNQLSFLKSLRGRRSQWRR